MNRNSGTRDSGPGTRDVQSRVEGQGMGEGFAKGDTVLRASGVAGGVLLAWNLQAIVDWIQRVFHVQFLSPDVYYISNLPSELHWSDVGWISLMAFAFALLATLYPAWRGARTQPAEALRYE